MLPTKGDTQMDKPRVVLLNIKRSAADVAKALGITLAEVETIKRHLPQTENSSDGRAASAS